MRLGRLLLPLLLIPTAVQAADLPLLDFVTITRNEQRSNDCALTFDDGPGEHTAVLLDLLQSQDIKATFFVLGKRVRQRPEIIQRMAAEGHEVGHHSTNHFDMRRLGKAERRKEITETSALLTALGVKPRYFRPPYGLYNSKIMEDLRREGLSTVLWSHDSEDWHFHTADIMEGPVLPVTNHSARGIFLFHDVHESTIAAMPGILDDLRSKGCRFVTIDQWVQDNILHPNRTPQPSPRLLAQPSPLPTVQPVAVAMPQPPARPAPPLEATVAQPLQATVKDVVARLILSWWRPASAVQ